MVLAESFLHTLDPVVLPISGSFGIRWYGLSYVTGFVIAWLFMRWMSRSGRSPLTEAQASDFLFSSIVGVLLGGRLGYAAFYDPHLFVGFSASFPWWDLLAINKGGMASHGGIIGFILACMVHAWKHGLPTLHLLDLGAFIAGVGLSIGRVANFVNAELWGEPWRGTGEPPWWTVKYPQEILHPAFPRHAEVEAALRPFVDGGASFLDNVVAAAQRGDQAVIDALTPLLTPYWPSQLLQAFTDGPILVPFLALVWIRPRRPGLIGAWFLVVYGALRILSELVRQPDEGVDRILGLSRGQLLSVLMVLAGIVSILVVSRRTAAPLGGWRRPSA